MIINVPTKAMSQWQTVLRVLPTRWRQKSSCTDIWIEITSLSPYVHRWTSSDSNRGAHKSRLVLIQSWLKTWIRLAISQTPDMELGHILWVRPSDPGIQRPGDPVDPVTLFYNELQMSTYVANKSLQWARGLAVFIAVWRLHASEK